MNVTDSPDEGSGNDTALSVDEGSAAIERLLSGVPETDSAQIEESENEGQDVAEPVEASAEEDDGIDGLELDDETDGEATDGPEVKPEAPMKFAPDEAKVTMPDGTTITVAELKAGHMFQSTFTKKTTEHKREKEAWETERSAELSQIAETKQQIAQQRDVIMTLAAELLPKEPTPVNPDEDPMGYMQYLAQRDEYQKTVTRLQYLLQSHQQEQVKLTESQKQEQERQAQEQKDAFEKAVLTEREKLFDALPKLKDDKYREQFRKDAVEIGTFYRLSQEEIDGILDHRYLRIFADAMAFRKAVAKRDSQKTPAIPAQPQQPRIPQRQRMAPQNIQSRDHASATERLRKTGTIDDGAKALMKFV